MKNMRKSLRIIAIFTVITLATFITIACDNDTTSDTTPGTTPGTTPQTVAKPTATPAGGSYNVEQTVTLATTTSDADIYYTLDGTNPTTTSTKYTNSITIGTNVTLKAIAIKTDMTTSEMLNETYVIDTVAQPVAKPTATPAGGNYDTEQTVTLTSATSDADIYYTLDGTNPTSTSTKYTNSITIGTSVTLKAIAVKTGMVTSEMLSETYSIVTTLAANVWTNGNIATVGDIQWFKFTATATTQYIHFEKGTLDHVYVKFSSDDLFQSSELYGSILSTSRTLVIGKEYQISVTYPAMGGSGTYRIAFNSVPFPPDGDNVTTLSANVWANGSIATGTGGEQWFKFTATAATQYIHFESGTLSGVYVQLYNSSGTTVGNKTTLRNTTLSMSQPVTNNDVYYIQVTPYSGSGAYRIAFNATTGSPGAKYDITQFSFADFSVNGTISGNNITVTVPNIVNLTTLAPTITHNGKSISPASGVAQDFTSSKSYTVTANDNTTKTYTVTVTVTNTTLATAFIWINSNNTISGRTYTIVAQANESLAPTTIDPTYSNINIILSGGTSEKTITLNDNGSLFTVSYGTLTLENNITLAGRTTNNASLVMINDNGKLVMKTGSKIQNNTKTVNDDDAYGGGVYIKGGTFTMDGGTISGNKVDATSSSLSYTNTIRAKGGGVYFYLGTFVMNGGTISNNTAYSNKFATAGGGVYVDDSETFTMSGGTISDNTAESSSVLATSYTYGGGVAIWDGGTFTMTSGTISGNTAKTASNCQGGGVYVRGTKFTKTGGTIYGNNESTTTLRNTAKDVNSGHAVYVYINASSNYKRTTTAGTTVNLNSNASGSGGGWE
jgi:hypothetical protein